MTLTPQQALFALILPMACALAGWGAWLWAGRGGKRAALAGLPAAIGVAGAFALAFFAVGARGAFPPTDDKDWLFYLLPAIVLLALPEGWLWFWLRPLCWAAAMTLPALMANRYLFRNEEIDHAKLAWTIAGWVAAAMAFRAAAGRTAHIAPKSATIVLGLTTAVMAALTGLHGSQEFPFRVGSVAIALLPLFVALFLVPKDRRVPPAALTTWAALTGVTMLTYYLAAEKLPVLEVALAAAAPVLAAAIPAKLSGWKGALARIGVALIPLGFAFGLALRTFLHEAADPYA